jgi:cell division protein FtsI/penicillin-binding protein 2
MYVVLALFGLFGAALISRLVFLQIANYGFYKALAQGQQYRNDVEKGERGEVFVQDKNGNLYTLATSQKVFSVFVTPSEVKEKEQTAQTLADILKIDKETILEKLEHTSSLYQLVKKRISTQEKDMLLQAKNEGVHLEAKTKRLYPHDSLASHVLGFVNEDGEGQYGIEEYYHDILEGKERLKQTPRNAAGYFFLDSKTPNFENGSDIVLTIDYNVQRMAEHLLENSRQTLRHEGGTIIVMEPSGGDIVALANTPSFNPDEYFQVEDLAIFQNPAIQKIYEPGSVFKAITMAAAIDAQILTPETTYRDKGMLAIGKRTIENFEQRVWGTRTMSEVLEFSINTGAVFAQQQLGPTKFLEYLDRFDVFRPTGIELASETSSENKELKKGYEITFATASFGQGIEMTPLQLVKAYSAIANNGVVANPTVVKQFVNAQGFPVSPQKSSAAKAVISPDTALQVTRMLLSVVDNGYAKPARIAGYSMAGKTGTAQISWAALGLKKSGYSDKTIQSFIGYFPAFNPRFLILVKLDNPQTKTAEHSAVPLFRELAKYIIDYYQIPPDRELTF